jgi:hypothetical protein
MIFDATMIKLMRMNLPAGAGSDDDVGMDRPATSDGNKDAPLALAQLAGALHK